MLDNPQTIYCGIEIDLLRLKKSFLKLGLIYPLKELDTSETFLPLRPEDRNKSSPSSLLKLLTFSPYFLFSEALFSNTFIFLFQINDYEINKLPNE